MEGCYPNLCRSTIMADLLSMVIHHRVLSTERDVVDAVMDSSLQLSTIQRSGQQRLTMVVGWLYWDVTILLHIVELSLLPVTTYYDRRPYNGTWRCCRDATTTGGSLLSLWATSKRQWATIILWRLFLIHFKKLNYIFFIIFSHEILVLLLLWYLNFNYYY